MQEINCILLTVTVLPEKQQIWPLEQNLSALVLKTILLKRQKIKIFTQ